MHLLHAHEICIERAGFPVFAPLTFALRAGEVLCVRGANGAGKTTLLRALAGLTPIASGELRWQIGEPTSAKLHYLGHQLGLRASLGAQENLQFLLALDGRAADTATCAAALHRVGLAGYADVAVATLSAGQRKRLCLARLLLSLPGAVWLLDEPFANLDSQGVGLVQDLVAEVTGAGGAVMHASHGLLGDALPQSVLNLQPAELP